MQCEGTGRKIYRKIIHTLKRIIKRRKVKTIKKVDTMLEKKKAEAIEEFQEDRRCRVMVANRRAGGIGVNLTAADYSIVFSRNYNLADELQSDARNYRAGSEMHQKITKISLVTPNTIDEIISDCLKNKETDAKNIFDKFRKISV